MGMTRAYGERPGRPSLAAVTGGQALTQWSAGIDRGARGNAKSRALVMLWVLFFLAAIGVAILGRLYFLRQSKDIIASKSIELAAVRDLKIEQIREWRAGMLRDGEVLAGDPTLRDEIIRWTANPSDPAITSTMRDWMALMVDKGEYSSVSITSADGSQRISTSGAASSTPSALAASRAARASGEVTLTDLSLDPETGRPTLSVVAPLKANTGQTTAVVVLNRDPEQFLFPILQKWPSPSPSSETLLIRRDGDAILYLNDLRFKSDTALKSKLPLTNSSLLAIQALTGPPRVTEGVDYRGVPVFGALGRVEGTPWYLIAKVNRSEAFAGVLESQISTFLAAGVVLAIIALGLAVAWRQRAVEYYRGRLDIERSEQLLSQQYDQLVRYANDAVLLTDEQANIVQANVRAVALYGYSADELLAMSLDELLAPEQAQPEVPPLSEPPEAEGRVLEIRQLHKNGELIYAETSMQRIETDGEPRYLTITRDVTERKVAEDALRQTTAYLENLFDYANAPIIVWDPQRHITRFNHAFERLTAMEAEEVLGKDLSVLFPEATREESLDLIATATEGEHWETVEIPIRRADGSVRTALWNSANVYDGAGDLLATIAQGQDITDRKLAEDALQHSEERFRNIVNSSPAAIYLYRLEPHDRLVLTAANPSSDIVIGIDHDDLIGKTIEEAFPALVGTDIPDMYRAVARGDLGSQSFEVPYGDARFSGYYAVTAFQTAAGLVAVDFVDISDRKRAEEALRERTEDLARSNAELEKFAYIASHDLQEPLRMVASYTQLLQRRYQGKLDQDADEFIAYAVDGAMRMQTLINELLVYSRVGTQGSPFVETDLDEVLGRVLEVLSISIAENEALITVDPMPTLSCDPIQMGQVFQNLLTNAMKFHGDEPPRIHVGAKHVDAEWVFSVQDNGIGVEPEYFDRIFVIFQRLQSRADYPGTGMGLAICKRIIERHSGRIWVESKQGSGSTFYFTLRD